MLKWLFLFGSLFLLPAVGIGEEIVLEVFPRERGGQPIYFILEGEKFTPSKPLKQTTGKVIDRQSPVTLLQEFLGTVFEGNSNRHKELFVPGETVESFLAPGSEGTELRVALKAILAYGEFVIAVSEIENQSWPELMKRVDGKFYFSEALNHKDQGWELFRSSYLLSNPTVFSSINQGEMKEMLSEKVYPLGNQESKPPIQIRYSGTQHNPALHLKGNSKRPEQNLTTPESALSAVYSATLTNDADWYKSLIIPEEVRSNKVMESGLTNSLKRASEISQRRKFAVEKKILFGPYAIFIFQNDDKSDKTKEKTFLVFKQKKDQWLLTDELNGDPFVNFFRNAPIDSSAAFPRIYFSP